MSAQTPSLEALLKKPSCKAGLRLLGVLLLASMLFTAMSLFSASDAYAQSANSREQAIAIAQKQSGGNGRVLAVREESTADGKRTYTVKIINNGRVRVIRVKGQ